jgi:hypothetical protein
MKKIRRKISCCFVFVALLAVISPTNCNRVVRINDFNGHFVEIILKRIDTARQLKYPIKVTISHTNLLHSKNILITSNKFVHIFPNYVKRFNMSILKDMFLDVQLSSRNSLYTKKTFYINNNTTSFYNNYDSNTTRQILLYIAIILLSTWKLVIMLDYSVTYYYSPSENFENIQIDDDDILKAKLQNVLKVSQLRTENISTYKDRSIELDNNPDSARLEFQRLLLDKSFERDDKDLLLLAVRVLK